MPEETFETPQPQPKADRSPDDTNWPKIILTAVLGFGLLVGAAYAGYWYGSENAKVSMQNAKTTPPVSQPTPEPTPTPEATPTPTPVVEDETEGWKTYVDDRYEYSMKYPSDWILEPTPSGMGAVARVSKGGAKIEIGVSMEELQQGQTLEEWIRDYPSLYEKKDITVLSQASVVVGGVTGIKRVSKLLDQDESLMVYIPRGTKVYFLSGGKELLTTFKSTFDQILSTFKFLD